jgi:hypothetical protein
MGHSSQQGRRAQETPDSLLSGIVPYNEQMSPWLPERYPAGYSRKRQVPGVVDPTAFRR